MFAQDLDERLAFSSRARHIRKPLFSVRSILRKTVAGRAISKAKAPGNFFWGAMCITWTVIAPFVVHNLDGDRAIRSA